jgi:hypothetical protein
LDIRLPPGDLVRILEYTLQILEQSRVSVTSLAAAARESGTQGDPVLNHSLENPTAGREGVLQRVDSGLHSSFKSPFAVFVTTVLRTRVFCGVPSVYEIHAAEVTRYP